MKKTWLLSIVALAVLCGTQQPLRGQSAPGMQMPPFSGGAYGNGGGQMVSLAGFHQSAGGGGMPLQQVSHTAHLTDHAGDACHGGGCCVDCYAGEMPRRFTMFGELLYLRARNAEVAYGVPVNGPIVQSTPGTPVPGVPGAAVGPVGVADHDFDTGFRFGGSYYLDGFSSIAAQYTGFRSSTADQFSVNPPNVARSLVSHPATDAASRPYQDANALYGINFDLVDLDYRRLWWCSDHSELTWLVGARYARLEQEFLATFANPGVETVHSDVTFDGGGVRFGLEGDYYVRPQVLVYAKGIGSLVAGEFRGSYQQNHNLAGTQVDTSWRAGRIMPILDLEVGTGLTSRCGTWRLSTGYVFSAWTNVVKTDQWIQSVRTNDYVGLSDTMTFDGFVARVEGRF